MATTHIYRMGLDAAARIALLPTLALTFTSCAATSAGQEGLQDGHDRESAGEFWYLRTAPRVELFIHEVGSGEPVVVLHGGPGADHSYMHGVADGLTDRFRFIFYDQRGSLRSTGRNVSYNIQDHVADLESLRASLNVERVHLLAHSAGTTLAYHYLEQYPQRVGRVVLTGAVHPVNGEPGRHIFDDEDRALFGQRPGLYEDFQNRPAVQHAIRAAGLENPAGPRDSARLAVLRQFAADAYRIEKWASHVPLRVNADAAEQTQRSINWNYDRTGLLSGHPYAITVVNGEYDYVVDLRGSPIWRKLVERHMPAVRVIVIPESGHSVWVDEPAAFARAVQEALR